MARWPWWPEPEDPWEEAPRWALELRKMMSLVIDKEKKIMSALTDALDEAERVAQQNSDADDAAEALLKTIAQLVMDLKAAGTDPGTVSRITALSSAISQRAARLGAAVAATPTS